MKRRPLFASLASSLAAILILAAGCGEQSPTASRLEPSTAATASAAGRGVGRRVTALKARYRAGAFSRTIGPSGGILPFRIGSLIVPPGALSEATQITAYVNGNDLAVQFEPHGLEFRAGHEPILAIRYGFVDHEAVQIYYFDDSGLVVEALATSIDKKRRSTSTRLHHFSAYGLAASL